MTPPPDPPPRARSPFLCDVCHTFNNSIGRVLSSTVPMSLLRCVSGQPIDKILRVSGVHARRSLALRQSVCPHVMLVELRRACTGTVWSCLRRWGVIIMRFIQQLATTSRVSSLPRVPHTCLCTTRYFLYITRCLSHCCCFFVFVRAQETP